jgi:hypothetical protein
MSSHTSVRFTKECYQIHFYYCFHQLYLTHATDVRKCHIYLSSRVHLELPDVLELLGSGPSRTLPLTYARLLLLLLPPRFRYEFLKMVGVPELLVLRDQDLKFTTPNNIKV